MGYRFELDAVNNIFRCSWEGRVTDDCFSQGLSAAMKQVASHPSRRVIDDYSGVTQFDVSTGTIERMARMQDTPLASVDSMIIVIAPKDVLYGLARMFSMIDEQKHPRVHVVRSMEQAHTLLRVASTQFSPIAVP